MKKQAVCGTIKKDNNNKGKDYRRRTIHGAFSIQDSVIPKTPQLNTARTVRKPLQVVSASKSSCNLLFSGNEAANPSAKKDTKVLESLVKFKSKLSFVSGKESSSRNNSADGQESSNEQDYAPSYAMDYRENSEHSSNLHSFVSMRKSRKLDFVVKESNKSNETKPKSPQLNSADLQDNQSFYVPTENHDDKMQRKELISEVMNHLGMDSDLNCHSPQNTSKQSNTNTVESRNHLQSSNTCNPHHLQSSNTCNSPLDVNIKDIHQTTEMPSKQTSHSSIDTGSRDLNHDSPCNMTSLSKPLVQVESNDDTTSKPSLKTFRRSRSGTLRKSLQETRISALKNTKNHTSSKNSTAKPSLPSSTKQGDEQQLLLKSQTSKDWMHLFEEPFPRRSPRLRTVNNKEDYDNLLENLSPLTSRENNRKRKTTRTSRGLNSKNVHNINSRNFLVRDEDISVSTNSQSTPTLAMPNTTTPYVDTPTMALPNTTTPCIGTPTLRMLNVIPPCSDTQRKRKSRAGLKRSKNSTDSSQECNKKTKEDGEEVSKDNNIDIIDNEEIHFPKPSRDLTKPGGPFYAVIDFCLPDKDFVKLKLAKIKGAPHINKISPCEIIPQNTLSQPAMKPTNEPTNEPANEKVKHSLDAAGYIGEKQSCLQEMTVVTSDPLEGLHSNSYSSDSIIAPALKCSSTHDVESLDGGLTKLSSDVDNKVFSDSILQPLYGTKVQSDDGCGDLQPLYGTKVQSDDGCGDLQPLYGTKVQSDDGCGGHETSSSDQTCDISDSQSLSESIFEPLTAIHNTHEESTFNKASNTCNEQTKKVLKGTSNENVVVNEEDESSGHTKRGRERSDKGTCVEKTECVPSSLDSLTPSPNETVLKGLYSMEINTSQPAQITDCSHPYQPSPPKTSTDKTPNIDNDGDMNNVNTVLAESSSTNDSFDQPCINSSCHGDDADCHGDNIDCHRNDGYLEEQRSCHGDNFACHGNADGASYKQNNSLTRSSNDGIPMITDDLSGDVARISCTEGSQLPSCTVIDINVSTECTVDATTCHSNSFPWFPNTEEPSNHGDSFPLCSNTDKLDVNHYPLTVGTTPTDKAMCKDNTISIGKDLIVECTGNNDDKCMVLGSEPLKPTNDTDIDNDTDSLPYCKPCHSEASEPSIADTATPSGKAQAPEGTTVAMDTMTPILMQACLQHENSESSPVHSISIFTYAVPIKREVIAVCLSHWIVIWIKVPGQDWTVFQTWTVDSPEMFQKVQFLPSSSCMVLFAGGLFSNTNARVYSCCDEKRNELKLGYNSLDNPLCFSSMCVLNTLELNQEGHDVAIVVAGETGNDCLVVKWTLDSPGLKALSQSRLPVPNKSSVVSLCVVEGSSYLLLGLTNDSLILWNHQSCSVLKTVSVPSAGLHCVEYFHATTQMGLVFIVLICQALKQKDLGHGCFIIALNPINNRLKSLFRCLSDSHSLVQTGSGCGQYIALGYNNGNVGLWNIVSSQTAVNIPVFKGCVDCISFHPTRPIVAFGGPQGCVHLYSLR